MTTDREVLLDVYDRLTSRPTSTASTDAAAMIREHVHATPPHVCSEEVERASRAAYAAGQARNAGSSP